MEIPPYPDSVPPSLEMRPLLFPLFQLLEEGISELSFASLYLFEQRYDYRISQVGEGLFSVSGRDAAGDFFMLPFGLPAAGTLKELFRAHKRLKAVSEAQASLLAGMGYDPEEDRDNFDYLYSLRDLADLPGKRFHKKRNLVRAFVGSYRYEGRPLLEEYQPDARGILESWAQGRPEPGDYAAADEALRLSEELGLCGCIYYVEERPAAYVLGEELAWGSMYAIHFEKALGEYKGLYQFVNQSFAAILPESYELINREQDLGDPGLRQAKLSYRPVDFVRKFTVRPPAG
jgi:hypothetical protein